MTQEAAVVVIGGGIIGSAVAYHLAELGVDGIAVLEKGSLSDNDGSTSHAPGGLRTLTVSKFFTKLGIASRQVYDQLPLAEPGQEQFFRTGLLQVASTPQRFDSYKRIQEVGASLQVPSELLTPDEVAERLPLMDPTLLAGGMLSPTSGVIKTSLVASSMQALAARSGRATFHDMSEVTEVLIENGRVVGVATSNPEHHRIACRQVIICSNIWAPVLAAKAGINMPLFPGEHQYAFTTPVPALAELADGEVSLPLCTIDDISIYFRQHFDRLGIGSYHHEARLVDPWALPRRAQLPFTPADFDEAWTLIKRHLPPLRSVTVDRGFNGMFAFTADHYPIMGESPVKGLWAAVGAWLSFASEVGRVMARWMTTGDPGMDVAVADINRFHDHQSVGSFLSRQSKYYYEIGFDILHPNEVASSVRQLRVAPHHDRTEALGAIYAPAAGYETPWYYESNASLVDRYTDQIPRRTGYDATAWSPIIGAEHLALRDSVGLVDWSASIAPIEIAGPGSLAYLEFLCTNDMDLPIGEATYTLILTPGGGIKRDVTVSRLGPECFWMLTGKSNLPAEMAYLRSWAPDDGSVTITDRSEHFASLGLWGPKAREVLSAVTDADLSDFPWYATKEISVGMAPARALRVSYVGELGWEIYFAPSFGRHVWDVLWAAGQEHEIAAVGLASLFSLRIEKGYRLIGSDIHPEVTPAAAGMSWLLKDGRDFLGRKAAMDDKPKHRLVTMRFADPAALMHPWSPVYSDETVVGWVASAEYGYSVGAFLAHAYVPFALATAGTKLRVRYTGRFFDGEVVKGPLWDPENSRLKA